MAPKSVIYKTSITIHHSKRQRRYIILNSQEALTVVRINRSRLHYREANRCNEDGHRNRQSRPGPYGMGIIAFTGLVTLLTAIVVGGAVGGGLGGALSHQINENK
jgi:hypothetical protein